MDKAKTNFIIVIGVLGVVCIVLAGYAAGLSSQLNSEKTRAMQLNEQLSMFNSKVDDLQVKLNTAVTKADDQTKLAAGLQSSLDAARTEIDNLKAVKAELESKLNAEPSGAVSSAAPAAKQ